MQSPMQSPMQMKLALLALALPLLGGCNAGSAPVATAPASQRFPEVVMPAGDGCAAVIGRFDAVMKADLETGNVNAKVYEQVQKELDPARSACGAGQDGQARAIVSATKRKHGYPG